MIATALPSPTPPPAPHLPIAVASLTPQRRPDRSAVAASCLQTIPIGFAAVRAHRHSFRASTSHHERVDDARDARRRRPAHPPRPFHPFDRLVRRGIKRSERIERHMIFSSKNSTISHLIAPPPAHPSPQTLIPWLDPTDRLGPPRHPKRSQSAGAQRVRARAGRPGTGKPSPSGRHRRGRPRLPAHRVRPGRRIPRGRPALGDRRARDGRGSPHLPADIDEADLGYRCTGCGWGDEYPGADQP